MTLENIRIGKEQEKRRTLKLIEKEIEELKSIDKKIPEKFKKLMPDETNQHMRIQASLSIAEELRARILGK